MVRTLSLCILPDCRQSTRRSVKSVTPNKTHKIEAANLLIDREDDFTTLVRLVNDVDDRDDESDDDDDNDDDEETVTGDKV